MHNAPQRSFCPRRLVSTERARGMPLAQTIASLRLEEGRAALLLPAPADSESDDSDDASSDGADSGVGDAEAAGDGPSANTPQQSRRARHVRVDVDLAVNAYTNAECVALSMEPGESSPVLQPFQPRMLPARRDAAAGDRSCVTWHLGLQESESITSGTRRGCTGGVCRTAAAGRALAACQRRAPILRLIRASARAPHTRCP